MRYTSPKIARLTAVVSAAKGGGVTDPGGQRVYSGKSQGQVDTQPSGRYVAAVPIGPGQ
jgi:hypothetical protein